MRLTTKTLLICGLFLLPLTNIYAQKFTGGLLLGLNGCQVNGDNMAGFNKGGVMAGLYVDYRFNPTWSGSFEMLYDMKGSKRLYTVDANGNAVSDTGGSWDQLNLSYLEIPFLAHYHLNKNFEIYAGPAIGILISSSYYPGQASIGSIGGEAPADFLKSYDFSGYFGVTYHFAAHWSGTVRYNNSLISFANGKSNPYGYINTGLTNIVITGGIYYDFVENKLSSKTAN